MKTESVVDLQRQVRLHRGMDSEIESEVIAKWFDRFENHPVVGTALKIGFEAHGQVNHQRRYEQDVPYFVHPLAVAINLTGFLDEIGLADRDTHAMISAALLHDVLEDTDFNPEEIEGAMGSRVLGLVQELSDVYTHKDFPDLNRESRKKLERERTVKISEQALMVKLFDLQHNLHDIDLHDRNFARVYRAEKGKILEGIVSRFESLEANSLLVSHILAIASRQLAALQ